MRFSVWLHYSRYVTLLHFQLGFTLKLLERLHVPKVAHIRAHRYVLNIIYLSAQDLFNTLIHTELCLVFRIYLARPTGYEPGTVA